VEAPGQDLAVDPDARRARRILERDPRANLELLPRVYERGPVLPVFPLQQQAFDAAAAGNPPADQPRRKHVRVVRDEYIAGIDECGQVPKGPLLPRARRSADYEQP
jgi:hypothetical protein